MSQYQLQPQQTQLALQFSSYNAFPQPSEIQGLPQNKREETRSVKMSYNDYLIQENDKIISVNLPDNSKHEEYQQIFKYHQKYQQQVQKFTTQTKTNGGGYYFYNWVSNDQLLCEIPTQGIRLLAILIFRYQYQKAQKLIQGWQKNPMIQMLLTVFKAFKNIYQAVEGDQQLSVFFLNRKDCIKHYVSQNMEINMKLILNASTEQLSETLGGYETLEEKKACILTNIKYLKQFLSYFPNTQISEYYRLVFTFMSNTEDQLESKNMYKLLLQSRQLHLLDRLNFVQLLMPLQDRKQFIKQFSIHIQSLTNLSNLLFYAASAEKQIEGIIVNYLDQYGDLESVASVSLELGLPVLMKFVDIYQEILVLSCEEKKAQTLEYQQYKKLGAYCMKKSIVSEPINKLFLNRVNFVDEKIQPLVHPDRDNAFVKLCYVCYRKNQFKEDLFVECGKCLHGGHHRHLLKWYEESNNVCPKPDCSCYCV